MEKKIEEIYKLFLAHPVVSTDSRQVPPGSIFFALRGESFNGNGYALQAIESGATAAIVDDPGLSGHPGCIVVEDVLQTLQLLAAHHRKQSNIPVVAITGTNGKTTTKELINGVLSVKYRTVATRGNLNNHIGVPLTLLTISPETELAIIEMGANHPGEIDFLCKLAQPDYGLITNIGKAHLEGFGSFEGVIGTKTELYRFLQKKDGKIFLNQKDPLLEAHAKGLDAVTYGAHESDLATSNITADPFVAIVLNLKNIAALTIETKLYGRYNADNVLAAACIGQYFKVDPNEIKLALEAYVPGNNRSQIRDTGRNLLIMDAYNANPTSMKAALETFAAADYTDKTLILGDMLELGTDTDSEHQEILKLADHLAFQSVYLVGPVFARLNTKRENICFHDSELARLWFEFHKLEKSTILMKGSRGIRLEKIVDVL